MGSHCPRRGARGAAGAAGGRDPQWLFGCCIKARCSAHTAAPPPAICLYANDMQRNSFACLSLSMGKRGGRGNTFPTVAWRPPPAPRPSPPRRAGEGRAGLCSGPTAQPWHQGRYCHKMAAGGEPQPPEHPPLPPSSPRPLRAPTSQTHLRILCLSSQSGAQYPSPLHPSFFFPPSLLSPSIPPFQPSIPPSSPPFLLFRPTFLLLPLYILHSLASIHFFIPPLSLLLHPSSLLFHLSSLLFHPPFLFYPLSLLLPLHPSIFSSPLPPLHPLLQFSIPFPFLFHLHLSFPPYFVSLSPNPEPNRHCFHAWGYF